MVLVGLKFRLSGPMSGPTGLTFGSSGPETAAESSRFWTDLE